MRAPSTLSWGELFLEAHLDRAKSLRKKMGTPPAQEKLMLDFLVVRVPSAYNAILGQTALNQLKVVVSIYYMKIKFPTKHGIEEVKGDQVVDQQCYMAACRTKNNETLVIKYLRDETKVERVKPAEDDLLNLELYPDNKDKTVRIGTGLEEGLKLKLFSLLRSYFDIFAWTSSHIPMIDPELREFNIKYKPRVTIKAQALIDFIVECTIPEDPSQLVISKASDPWLLYVDGSSTIGSSEVSLTLVSLEKFVIEYALCFDFQALNNEAEYEALLAGIRLAHSLKVDSLSIHNNSQLVVNHVLGEYEARDKRMIQYLQAVRTQTVKFKIFTIHQIQRDQNAQADSLSRLASTDVSEFFRAVYIELLKKSIRLMVKVDAIEQEPC
ncbi:hypothetical protein RJ639_043529 [Escallonia herrerae]|uniref:RNase H type-1 domain-containing protein n=1 Tax=Escallonia herrerae TaxID=1293975 RepID=A0AA89B346_9ASTE|nr:hypothetical protein RJ639_043529 [Escallonia herrerae]